MRNYKKLLSAGNAAQLEKLKANEHKSGFDDIDIFYAFKRLRGELSELKDELFKGLGHDTQNKIYNIHKVRAEAADVANFAHMIILACDQENRKAF